MNQQVVITNVIDNNEHPQNKELKTEHGLSFYFEIDGMRWLYDVGASDKFKENLDLLQIDITAIDYLLLSHGHKDHTGGLKTFLEGNKQAEIITAASCPLNKYYSLRHENKRDISIDGSLLIGNSRWTSFSSNHWISKNVAIVFNKSNSYSRPEANRMLTIVEENSTEKLDPFTHEISICIKTPTGLIILSACSHNGALNIISSCCEFTQVQEVRAFIGGMHLLDGEYETKSDLENIAEDIQQLYPTTCFYTGHCTGEESMKTLKLVLGDSLQTFYSGFSIIL